jgi:signal transduction histidine kinase/CheY-like chemotaxis protein
MSRFLGGFFPGWTRALLCGLALVSAGRASEAGIPPVEHFGVRTYAQHNQTWSAVQDRAGVLYVGNKDVVLTYDGQRWGTIPTGGIFVRGLDLDAEDRVWVGAVDEFGYLESDGRGGRRFVSLRAHWNEPPGTFVRQTLALPHGVYFVTETSVLRWHDGKLARVREGRARAFAVRGELVVQAAGQGVVAFDGERWRDVIDTPEIRKDRVLFLQDRPDGSWIVGLQRGALWTLANGVFARWPTPVDEALRQRTIDRGWLLRDGSIAISQRPGGLLLLNPDGSLRHYLDTANGGLNADYVINVFQDRRGDLWVSQNSGISRIAWSGGFTTFGAANGLGKGSVLALHRHQGKLYVGTTDGLFRLEPADADAVPARSARFALLPGGDHDVWVIASAGNEVLFAGRGGLHAYDPATHTGKMVFGGPGPMATALLVPSGTADRAYVAMENQLFAVRRRGDAWENLGAIAGVDGELRLMREAADGAVWAAAASRGFYRLIGLPGTRSDDGKPVRVERYFGEHGLVSVRLAGLPLLAEQKGELAFLDEKRIFSFDARERVFRERFAAEKLFPFTVTGMPTLAAGRDGHWWTRTFREDAEAGPWRGRQFWRIAPDGSTQLLPFAATDVVGENPFFREEAGEAGHVVWLGGSEGLLRAELPAALTKSAPFRVNLRRVTGAKGEALPLADADEMEGEASAEGEARRAQRSRPTHELPFAAQEVTLQFATDRLDDRRMRFQTRLNDEPWTALSETATLALDRLPPGTHTVAIRARDADGQLSAPAKWSYVVLAPWWRTDWAITGYMLTLIGAFFGALRWQRRRLERRNRELERIIDDRTAELREAKRAAEIASEAKSAFLANMSHELRTPLNAILGFAQILRRSPQATAEQRARLEIIRRNGDHLLAMINEILDLSKIEAGRLTLYEREVGLRSLLTGIAETFMPRLADKNVAFRLDVAADVPERVRVDETKLRQVLFNLLGNAQKFTERGSVTLGARVVNWDGAAEAGTKPGIAHVEFWVTDSGVGIASAEQSRLFEPFMQTRAGVALAQGTGLGLAISQRLVQLMGGVIRCESREGQGSRFAFRLPLPVARGATGPGSQSDGAGGARIVMGYKGERRRLLVVDDEAANRAVLRGLLEPLGFSVEECAGGAACVEAFRRQAADAVLLDLRMPGALDGYATARALRRLPGGTEPAIIAVSASVFESDRQTAIDAGCDDFLPKPFDEERLFATLGECLDLAWSYVEHPAARVSGEAGGAGGALMPAGARLPAKEAEELLELARRGDLRALRERLAEVAGRHPECAALVAHIDGLAAGFQLGRLRQELRRAGVNDASA